MSAEAAEPVVVTGSAALAGQIRYADKWKWLESTRLLQEQAFGYTFPMEGKTFTDYVTWNSTAIVAELGEMLAECPGQKIWVDEAHRGDFNRGPMIKELVDMCHFVANILVGLGVTDEEWEAAYTRKQQINRDRMASGYTGQKSSDGHRALDD